MQYELWARSRETKQYQFLEPFQDEVQKFYMIDKVDPELYYEAMIVKTDWGKMPECVMYKELKIEQHKVKKLTR